MFKLHNPGHIKQHSKPNMTFHMCKYIQFSKNYILSFLHYFRGTYDWKYVKNHYLIHLKKVLIGIQRNNCLCSNNQQVSSSQGFWSNTALLKGFRLKNKPVWMKSYEGNLRVQSHGVQYWVFPRIKRNVLMCNNKYNSS